MRLLCVLAIFTALAFGQAQPVAPDCGPWFFQRTTAGSGTVTLNGQGDNRFVGCDSWTVMYASTGFTALSLTFQSAPGSVAIGSFVTFAGATNFGNNPMTNTTGGTSRFSNPATGAISFVRLNLSGLTGSGTVSAVFYGYRTGANGGGGGSGSGCSDPCTVIGPDATGGAPTENPVQVSGVDSSGNVQRVLTDTTGRVNTAPCLTTERVNVAATGPTQIVSLNGMTSIHVCNFTAAVDGGAALDVSFVYGTGANCGIGTTTLAGPYDQITALDLWSKDAPLTIPAGNALCLTNSAATAFTGVIVYAQY